MNKSVPDPSRMLCFNLCFAMDLGGSLFKQGWRGGDDILVVDLCPRAPSLRHRAAQEVFSGVHAEGSLR